MTATQRNLPPFLIAFLLIGLHFHFGTSFIRSSAATYDEPLHLTTGYIYWMTGRYRLTLVNHPPLAAMWDAAPLLWLRPNLFSPIPNSTLDRLYPYQYADYFLYHNRIDAERMLNSARFFSLFSWTALLAFAVLAYSRRLAGGIGMIGAALAYAFCPALISNMSLATTDAASTVFFFMTFWILADRERRSLVRWAAAGACLGLANASKPNMMLIGPIVTGLLILEWRLHLTSRPSPRVSRFPSPMSGFFLFFISGLLVLAAIYRFRQFPLYWQSLFTELRLLNEGRPSFFFGRYSTTGTIFYFPVALEIKMPLATLILAGTGVLSMMRKAREEALWLILPPLAYFAAALMVKVQIGYRHILPVIPFLIVWAGCGAAWAWKHPWGKPALALLSAWLGWSVWRIQPHDLAYFNELVGGPSHGYEYLVDSNLDWGQGLKDLATQLKTMGNPPIYLSYFGMADPAAYGIHYTPVGFASELRRTGDTSDPSASGRVLLAVSATNFQSTYYARKGLFDWLRTRTPLRTLGYSMFLFDLTGDSQAYRNLAFLLEHSKQPEAAKELLLKLQKLDMAR